MADETDELPQSPQPFGNANATFTTAGVRPPLQIDPAAASFHTQGAAGPAPEPLPEPSFTAYHGSPYDFERFSSSQIGTGEGAQAYGHGLYFAGNPAVAKEYQGQLSIKANVNASPQANQALYYLQQNNFDKAAARTDLETRLGQKLPDSHPLVQDIQNYSPGHLYQVQINADPEHFLDWDKPLSEQHPHVQGALQSSGISTQAAPPITDIKDLGIRSIMRSALRQNEGQAEGVDLMIDNDQALYNAAYAHAAKAGRDLDDEDIRASDYVMEQAKPFLDKLGQSQNMTGEKLINGMDRPTASSALRAAGIPGIKYLDQGSRNISDQVQQAQKSLDYWRGIGDPDKIATSQRVLANAQKMSQYGTHNYVVFDDNLINIVKKNGLSTIVNNNQAHFKTTPVDHDPFGDE